MISANDAGFVSASRRCAAGRPCTRRGPGRRAGRPPRAGGARRPRDRGRRGPATTPATSAVAPWRPASSAMARPMPLVPPTTSIRAPARVVAGVGSGPATRTAICSIRSAITMSIRVVIFEVDLVAGNGQHPGPRHVAEHEAAVVRGAQVARRLGGGVGPREDADAERLGRLASPVAVAVRDLDDVLAIHDDQRVGARDDRVGGVGAARDDRLDRALDHLQGHERPHRIVDQRRCRRPRRRGRRGRCGCSRCGSRRRRRRSPGSPAAARRRRAARLLQPARVRDDDQLVDPAPRMPGGCAAGSARRPGARTVWASRRRTGWPSPPARMMAWICIVRTGLLDVLARVADRVCPAGRSGRTRGAASASLPRVARGGQPAAGPAADGTGPAVPSAAPIRRSFQPTHAQNAAPIAIHAVSRPASTIFAQHQVHDLADPGRSPRSARPAR